jgi:hypothetical protein
MDSLMGRAPGANGKIFWEQAFVFLVLPARALSLCNIWGFDLFLSFH